jgi:hypothetical protein
MVSWIVRASCGSPRLSALLTFFGWNGLFCVKCVGLGVSPLNRDGDPGVVISGIAKHR